MTLTDTVELAGAKDGVAKAWLRALALTASIPRARGRLLSDVIAEVALGCGDAPALLSDQECFDYATLVCRQNQYARWALAQQLKKGEVVGLLMPNRPEYCAAWLGITSIGGVVALLNTNLPGASLAHCINVVRPKHIVIASELSELFEAALPALEQVPAIWIHGQDGKGFPRIDPEVNRQPGDKLRQDERRALTVEDRALYIFTSGTTGMPKAANVSHARILQWSYWFAGMMDAQREDRIYSCLPMYHSIGGVLVPGAMLAGGGSMVMRDKFSATHFWQDVIRWDCTMIQYIGELCRYLLHAAPSSAATAHHLRMACGNGMAPDVWEEFQSRFRIPRILEFYASTEGGLSLFNVEGKRGAIGRIPPYLAHRFSPALVRFDAERAEPVRDEDGFCIRCEVNETGEALGRVVSGPDAIGTRFEGYTDGTASERKILRDVFEAGDAWVRTGDLMRRDGKGFYYFVDRVGDTFRWKGENVATTEVEDVLRSFPGVRHASVYGVAIPGAEGRAGMAAVVLEGDLDWTELRSYLTSRLPGYARPIFLRARKEMAVTGTFKYSKADLVRQGYDPSVTEECIYFDSPEVRGYVPLDRELFARIRQGLVRL
jgi:fatty-acyl-CoA synthase